MAEAESGTESCTVTRCGQCEAWSERLSCWNGFGRCILSGGTTFRTHVVCDERKRMKRCDLEAAVSKRRIMEENHG